MSHFWRACGYLKPYRPLVVISIFCALCTGALTATGLGALLPLLNVLVNGQGVRDYVDQRLVQSVHGVTLVPDGNGWRVVRARADGKDDPALPVGTFLADAEVTRRAELDVSSAGVHWRVARALASRLPSHPVGAIAVIFVGFMGIATLSNVARFFQEYLSDTCAISAITDIRRKLYDHVLHLPLGYFSKHGTGDLTARLVTDAQGLQDGFKTVLGKAIQEPITAGFALVVALLIDWRLTLFIVLFAPLMVLVVRKFGTKVRRAMRAALEKNSAMLGQVDATLSGIRVVKSAAAEPHERRRYRDIMAKLKHEQFRMARYEAWSTPALEMLGLVAVGAVLVFASYFVLVDRSLQASQFMVIMFSLAVIGESLRRISKLNNVLQRGNAAASRLFEVLDQESERRRDRGTEQGAMRPGGDEMEDASVIPSQARNPALERERVPRHAMRFERSIAFDRVTFRYPGAEQPALVDVSFDVPKGTSVAVVGRNGSGKTTLLSLLPRFFDPQAGAVRVDGVDVRDWPIRRLRRMIGIVTQDAVVFPGTIHDNIAYARAAATRDEVIDAARRAYAHEFIVDKPLGYDTPLDGLGSQLSGGQRQRINIARAILRNAPVLILDEATSQVDAESEHLIQQAIQSLLKDRTTFVIAHRFSTILSADVIVVLERGEVVGMGKHDDLIRSCGTYRQLYERQLLAG